MDREREGGEEEEKGEELGGGGKEEGKGEGGGEKMPRKSLTLEFKLPSCFSLVYAFFMPNFHHMAINTQYFGKD